MSDGLLPRLYVRASPEPEYAPDQQTHLGSLAAYGGLRVLILFLKVFGEGLLSQKTDQEIRDLKRSF